MQENRLTDQDQARWSHGHLYGKCTELLTAFETPLNLNPTI